MDQSIHASREHTPALEAASVYRLLLADEIAVALTSGASVAATGTRDTEEVLDLTANALTETGVRVLQFRPPLDGASFISQFAIQWRGTGKGLQDLVPHASGERFVMLVHEAHTMASETLLHLDRMARAWPGMQMAFAGLPSLVNLLQSEDYPSVRSRVTLYTKIAVTEVAQQEPVEEGQLAPLATEPLVAPEQPVPDSSTPTFTIPSGSLGRTGYYPINKRQQRARQRRRMAAAAVVVAAAGLATAVATVPELQEWAGSARIAVANLLPDTPVKLRAAAPQVGRSTPNQAATQPTTPSEPVPAPLWTAHALDSPASQTGHPANQLTLLGDEQVAPPSQDVAVLTPAPELPEAPTRTINPLNAIRAEPPQEPAPPGSTVPLPASAAAIPSISSELASAMTKRGRAMLEWGDVSAARLLLTRATSAGSGEAAFLMGTTFDAATLDRIGAVGIPPDPVQAAAWFRVALLLGEERARAMLDNEPTNIATAKPKDSP